MSLESALKKLRPLLKVVAESELDPARSLKLLEKAVESYETVRSEPEVRNKAKGIIRDIVATNPDAELDSREVNQRAGLKPVPADEAFTRGQIKKLRIEYKQAAE